MNSHLAVIKKHSLIFYFLMFFPVFLWAQVSEKSLLSQVEEGEINISGVNDLWIIQEKDPETLLSALSVLPPPGNDNYAAGLNPPYVLSPNAGPCVSGTTTQASWQAGEVVPGCHTAGSTMSVWYSFQATAANMWVSLLILSGNCYTAFGVYRVTGPGIPGAADLVGCVNYPNTNPTRPQAYKKVNLTGLTIGAWYAIQVTYPNAPGCGGAGSNFCIAVGTPSSCATCSSPCGPACTFPTGPPTITQVTTTCPPSSLSPPMNEMETRTRCHTFTANYPSMSLQMIILGYYCGTGNVYSFNWTLYSTSCGAPLQSGTLANLTLTGLTAGQNYVLCYNWQAACDMDTVWPYLWSNSPLPVELVDFIGYRTGKKIKLEWQTASEKNSSYFIVERTTDGEQFIPVAKVPAAGHSSQLLRYEAMDESPAEGRNFYRLHQVDNNGDVQFSKLIEVGFFSQSSVLYLHPNPLNQDKLTVEFRPSCSGEAEISLFDISGRKIISDRLQTTENQWVRHTLKLPELRSGLYYIRVFNGLQLLSEKLLLND
jgi:hypothetical protein